MRSGLTSTGSSPKLRAMTSETITLHAGRESFRAAFFPSETAEHGPGLIVVHEWWGLNENIRAMGARFAQEGFTVLVPDLYGGKVTSDAAEAGVLMQALKTEHAMEIVAACAEELTRRTGKKVGITGFCMGGAMAFAAAASVPSIACAVPFYGIPKAEYWDASKMRCPIQAHFAKVDDWARADEAEKMAAAVRARGGSMEVFVYDAGHAFMRDGDATTYSPENAKLAWSRATSFLRTHLG